MLGMMAIPHSITVYKAAGQTVKISNQYGLVWNPNQSYSDFEPIGQTGYYPIPVSGGYNPVGTTYYFDNPRQQYANIPWLIRCNTKDGEATLDIANLNITPFIGNDIGSTPYKICLKDNTSSNEAWGFIGAAGGGPAQPEMLTSWTESVQGEYDFDVFTASGSTITQMEILDTLGKDGLAYTNTFTLVEGQRYRLTVNVNHTGGYHYYPDLYLGTPEATGRLLKDDLLETENRIEFVASAEDATQTCIWLYLGGNSKWSNCTFTMKNITGPVTGDELFTGWTASGGYSKSNATTFVAGRKYRIYTNYANFINTIYVRMGTVDAADGREIGYLRADYPNYFEFTATAADVTGGRVWLETEDAAVTDSLSLMELTEQNVVLGGAHIVSTDGGSTRNWTSVSAGFDWNNIRSYQIITHDAVLLTEKKFHIQVRDISTNTWAKGWLGLEGTGESYNNHDTVVSITKNADAQIVMDVTYLTGHLIYFAGLSQMTQLNGLYLTLGECLISGSPSTYKLDYDTSNFNAETSGGAVLEINRPPLGAFRIFEGPNVSPAQYGNFWGSIDTGFKFNRTDYEVYITLER